MRFTLTVYNKGLSVDKYHFDTLAAVDKFVDSIYKSTSHGAGLELFEHSTGICWITDADIAMDIDGSVIWYRI